jgi:hypothetical protein
MAMSDERQILRDWHRLFGLLLTDFFTDSPFEVELERDLSQQQQLLDVLIVRRKAGRLKLQLPDGLDDLIEHNLITFKSHRETLDAWAIKEFVGHYVAYRKLASPSPARLLPEERFRLYAVCARFPHNLSNQVPWQARQTGVYDYVWGTDTVRVVVTGELPREAHNAPLHLFSASAELVGFGSSAYRRRSPETSALLGQLFERFEREGFVMSYTMADFRRDYIKEHLPQLPVRERREILESLPSEERRRMLESLPPEERREILESLPPEERREILESLPPEERREILESLPPEERLAGLSEEQIRQYLERMTARRSSSPRKPKRRK